MQNMEMIYAVLALAMVAVVALGRPVRAKLNRTGIEIATVAQSRTDRPKKNLRKKSH